MIVETLRELTQEEYKRFGDLWKNIRKVYDYRKNSSSSPPGFENTIVDVVASLILEKIEKMSTKSKLLIRQKVEGFNKQPDLSFYSGETPLPIEVAEFKVVAGTSLNYFLYENGQPSKGNGDFFWLAETSTKFQNITFLGVLLNVDIKDNTNIFLEKLEGKLKEKGEDNVKINIENIGALGELCTIYLVRFTPFSPPSP